MTTGDADIPPGSFRIERSVRDSDGAAIDWLEAAGEIDLSCADELAEALGQFDPPIESCVVLDLRRVGFMDSSGLAVVMGAVERIGSRFAVVVAEGEAVDRLFDLTEARSTVPAFFDADEAIRSVAAPADEE